MSGGPYSPESVTRTAAEVAKQSFLRGGGGGGLPCKCLLAILHSPTSAFGCKKTQTELALCKGPTPPRDPVKGRKEKLLLISALDSAAALQSLLAPSILGGSGFQRWVPGKQLLGRWAGGWAGGTLSPAKGRAGGDLMWSLLLLAGNRPPGGRRVLRPCSDFAGH